MIKLGQFFTAMNTGHILLVDNYLILSLKSYSWKSRQYSFLLHLQLPIWPAELEMPEKANVTEHYKITPQNFEKNKIALEMSVPHDQSDAGVKGEKQFWPWL